MKCENCGNQLGANAIVCRVCNHNNTRRAVSQWRARRTGESEDPQSRPIMPRPTEPRITARKEIDANLLRFPASSRPAPGLRASQVMVENAEPASSPASSPAWREQVKEKVRIARERRQVDAPVLEVEAPAAPPLEKNPIVESALKRIHRTPQMLAIPVRGSGPTAQVVLWEAPGTSEAEELDEPSSSPESLPPIAPRAEERFRSEARPQAPPQPAPPAESPAKSVTSPVTDHAANTGTRTLLPKISPFAPTPKPEAKPQSKPDTVTLSPRSKQSQNFQNPQSPQHQSSAKPTTTEIIEMGYTANRTRTYVAKPVTLWVRTLAAGCDFEVVATAYLPLFGAFATLNTTYGVESLFVMGVLLAACVFSYQLVTLLIAGRTFGMAMLRLQLVNTDDDQLPVTRRQRMLRAWAATIAFCCPPLNLLITKLNYLERSLPDLISGTTIAASVARR
ncbi:MAG: RDD family protein [Blastocatellia bacterium]